MEILTIGQAARKSGVKVDTLRYYEQIGLVERPQRTNSGYRQYPQSVVERVRFIQRAKELGFSLREIRELLEIRVSPETGCAEIKRAAEIKLADVERKIAELDRIRRALVDVTHACIGEGPLSDCPILDALEGEGEDHS